MIYENIDLYFYNRSILQSVCLSNVYWVHDIDYFLYTYLLISALLVVSEVLR